MININLVIDTFLKQQLQLEKCEFKKGFLVSTRLELL